MLAFTYPGLQREEETGSLATAHYVSVTTFRHNGIGVATPVEFVMQDGSLYFRTLPDAGKVKRIRREPRVLLARCTMRGRLTGHKLAGIATLLSRDETQALLPAFDAKYGLVWRILARLRRPRSQGVRVDLPS
jgi:PPOX class probable F420-dependent enzyme